ncbi:MAG: undecaprenyl-diphosphatase UppP [Anaerolineae bacterium]|nr:undecaprenyl-diphosphatase UppP [Anaerolineae bacterium]
MSIIEAIFLGILQGATEFLPISSSGHLVIIPAVVDMPPADLTMIGVLHLGTLLAVLVYFWRDLWGILTAVLRDLRRKQPLASTEARLGWLIVVGSIPAVVLGLLFESKLEEIFSQPEAAAFFLLITAVLLVIGERMMSGQKSVAQMRWADTLIIGSFQAFALLPGISRSGSTIVGGLIRGLDRPTATRFSFLLGVPAIMGAGLLSLLDIVSAQASEAAIVYAAGFVAAAVTGYLCIAFLLRWVRSHTLYIFAVYCAIVGGGYLLVSLLGSS